MKKKFGDNVDVNKVYEISFWDYRGIESVYNEEFIIEDYKMSIPKQTTDRIRKILDEYSRGEINCSGCTKKIKRDDIAGHFYAASFCINCWLGKTGKYKGEGGWQAREKRESYN